MPPPEIAPRRIGILGGMGPAAAIDLQAKILAATPAASDPEHLPVVVWNVPQVPDRVAAVLGRGPSPLPAIRLRRDIYLEDTVFTLNQLLQKALIQWHGVKLNQPD